MAQWFLVKLRYQREEIVSTRNGDEVKLKTITEQYLVDAVSYTDAEALTHRNMAANTPDFSIFYIHPQKIADVFFTEDGGENWYACKVVFTTEDDKGRVKKLNNLMYINAADEGAALDGIKEQLKPILLPSEIVSVTKTKVLDVWPYATPD